jgi:hypothetical protein
MRSRSATLCGLAATLAALAAPVAHACSPIKVIGLYFERDSSTVAAAQVSRLANWMADLRERYANHQAIYIGASTEPGEHAPGGLGMERARNVARVLQKNLQFPAAKIELPSRSHVEEPAPASMKKWDKSQGVRGVQLDFLPACPHECPCQMGDPLYNPQEQRR